MEFVIDNCEKKRDEGVIIMGIATRFLIFQCNFYNSENYDDKDASSPDFVVCLFVFSLNLAANNQI